MLYIETKGSFYEMGRQLGKHFYKELKACIEQYAPWAFNDIGKYAKQIKQMKLLLQKYCPEVLEETQGIVEGTGLSMEILLAYRTFTDIKKGCSCVFFKKSDRGAILGRNCDLSPAFDPDIQLCQVMHPKNRSGIIKTTYLGLVGGAILTEEGFAFGGVSAHCKSKSSQEGNLPGSVLLFYLALQKFSLKEALNWLKQHKYSGKSMNLLIADYKGNSAIVELTDGASPFMLPLEEGKDWQACTNFFQSGHWAFLDEPEYLESAYAGYGRIIHQIDNLRTPRTLEGLKSILKDIAQPSPYNTGKSGKVKTAYSQIFEIAHGIMYLAEGHPKERDYKEIKL